MTTRAAINCSGGSYYTWFGALAKKHICVYFGKCYSCMWKLPFNSPISIQPCNHPGASKLLYTFPSLSYRVLIYSCVQWNTWAIDQEWTTILRVRAFAKKISVYYGKIRPWNHSRAWTLSYTFSSLSYRVLIYTWVKGHTWAWSERLEERNMILSRQRLMQSATLWPLRHISATITLIVACSNIVFYT